MPCNWFIVDYQWVPYTWRLYKVTNTSIHHNHSERKPTTLIFFDFRLRLFSYNFNIRKPSTPWRVSVKEGPRNQVHTTTLIYKKTTSKTTIYQQDKTHKTIWKSKGKLIARLETNAEISTPQQDKRTRNQISDIPRAWCSHNLYFVFRSISGAHGCSVLVSGSMPMLTLYCEQ